MSRKVAFLRAINLGPNRKFAKADIVAATEAAGGSDVATHINTGNVRLDTRMRSRARIEAALERAYRERAGFDVPTVVFAPDELRTAVADADELAAAHPDLDGAHYVSLLKNDPDAGAVSELEAAADERAVAVVRRRAVHLLMVDPYHQARLGNAEVEKRLGIATNRNLRVIRAIVDKWC